MQQKANTKEFYSSKPSENFLSEPSERAKTTGKKVRNRTRGKTFNVRLTSEEFDIIYEKYLASKLTRPEFLLALIKEKPIYVIEKLPDIFRELQAQGNNINQIARAINRFDYNMNEYHVPEKDYQETMERLRKEINLLKEEHKRIYQTVLNLSQEVLK